MWRRIEKEEPPGMLFVKYVREGRRGFQARIRVVEGIWSSEMYGAVFMKWGSSEEWTRWMGWGWVRNVVALWE
jgi:hypothetical protein